MPVLVGFFTARSKYMTHPKATITVHTTVADPVAIYAVEYHHNPGERSFYQGVQDAGTVIQRAGWLALHTPAFPGWNGAYIIDVSDEESGDISSFEITRSFNYPLEEDGWLWFPVRA
jgi:hypothetical protein